MRCVVLVAVVACCGRVGFESPDARPATADAPRAAVDAPRLSFDAGECPPGYQFVGTSCYRKSTTTAQWLAAELACEADAVGAHLAVVESEAERLAVVGLGVPGDTWIGESRRQISGFRTVIDTPGYLAWGPGEPGAGLDCVAFTTDDLMYALACGDIDRYFCEYDGIAAVPSTY